MAIERVSPDHSLWSDFCAHLERHGMAREVVQLPDVLLPGMYVLAAVEADRVIGHVALKMQPITIPAAAPGAAPCKLKGPGGRSLRELFVQTFAVDAAYRRQGHGRALQLAALELARCLGCYQLRSWSSQDKAANYALKLGLGFAVHPAIQHAADGTPVCGVYFVKAV